MTRGRKPRKPRVINANVMGFVLARATRLQAHEVEETMHPTLESLARLRQGVATEAQHEVMHTVMLVAMGIEDRRIVRGLRAHFQTALDALAEIRKRATKHGAWCNTALYFNELDALREAVDLHRFQLEQVTAGELQDITRVLIARTQSSGGQVIRTTEQAIGLQAA